MESQEKLQEIVDGKGGDRQFYERFPIWRCPACQHLNVYVDTFGETCSHCSLDATLTWEEFIVFPLD